MRRRDVILGMVGLAGGAAAGGTQITAARVGGFAVPLGAISNIEGSAALGEPERLVVTLEANVAEYEAALSRVHQRALRKIRRLEKRR